MDIDQSPSSSGASVSRSSLIASVCSALSSRDLDSARTLARTEYPFTPITAATRAYSELDALRIFHRDGFIDRYSGERLVFPAVLRLLSNVLPECFPRHPNWKMTATHIMFWELFPTVDHVVPVARGGADAPENWVTASMLRNGAKSNWLLSELGWTLHPPGDVGQWDGLMGWFLEYARAERSVLRDAYVKRWHGAARAVGS